ncbi:MAG: hypothetical protein FJ304_22310 [Planctomycetes bacterium]|nr:hypothetical protein [Planctomycetota bacterium]
MTALGKLLVVLNLVIGLGALSWSANLYVHRPSWFNEPPEFVDKGSSPVGFKQLDAEAKSLHKIASVTTEAWGVNLKALEDREKYRADRVAGYAERILWAKKGNPKDLIDKDNPKTGKGFYEPVIEKTTNLHDLTLVAGLPKGAAVLGTDGRPLPGGDGLLDSIAGDTAASLEIQKEILKQEAEFDRLDKLVIETETKLLKMVVIRDSIQNEWLFLTAFEVNASETRDTVFRRERQLRARLKVLGIIDP